MAIYTLESKDIPAEAHGVCRMNESGAAELSGKTSADRRSAEIPASTEERRKDMKKKIIGAVLAALMLGGAVTVYAKDITEPNAEGVYVLQDGDTLPLKICPLGDVTYDGNINSADVLRLRLYVAKKVKFDSYQEKLANVTKDETAIINSADVLKMRLFVAKKISDF